MNLYQRSTACMSTCLALHLLRASVSSSACHELIIYMLICWQQTPPLHLLQTIVSFQFVSHRFISRRTLTEGGLVVSTHTRVINTDLLPSPQHSVGARWPVFLLFFPCLPIPSARHLSDLIVYPCIICALTQFLQSGCCGNISLGAISVLQDKLEVSKDAEKFVCIRS